MSAEDAVWITQQDRHRQRVNEKCSEFRNEILESRICNSDHQRGDKRPPNATKSADGDDDEEVNEVVERIAGGDCQQIRSESAAEGGKAAAERESSSEKPRCVDTESFSHAKVVNGRAELCSQPCSLDSKPQQGDNDCAA
jgi:hypothetical protein